MKKLIFILLLTPFAVKAQNYTVGTPSMRVNTSGAINLTTTWQTINFNGSSANNFNLYPKDPTTGNQMIWWDSANQLFRVYGNYNRNLTLQLFPKYTTTIITTGATMQMRCVIPNGVSPGVDKYFPFPDDGGYADIANVTQFSVAQNQPIIPISVYTNSALITNGFYIQLRLSNALFGVGVCTLNSAAVVVQSPF